ncbi:MAG: type II toxin-antitoxin system prevent-host-death family antitoxin [Planctomycetota bacterium]
MDTVNTGDAKAHFTQLIARAIAGEEIIIAEAGRPVARLVGFSQPVASRTGGQWKGKVRLADDFDAPLPPEIGAAFDGRNH